MKKVNQSSKPKKQQQRKQQIRVVRSNQNTNQNPRPKRNRRNRRNFGNGSGFNGRNTSQIPFTTLTGNQVMQGKMMRKRVAFTEELGSISGSVGFANTAFSMNPGQAGTFPWLALEARQWEKYSFVKCAFQYTPQVTELSPNGVGSIILSFDSDASDAPPNDVTHALNVNPRSFNLPCKPMVLDIDPKIMNMRTDGFYVRPGGLPGGSDIKTYDCGNFNISTTGQTNTDPIGILCVKYIVDFFIPILEPTFGPPVNNSVSSYQSGTTEASGATTVAAYLVFNTEITNGCKLVNGAGQFTLPAGNYLVDAWNISTCSGTTLDSSIFAVRKNGTSLVVGTHPVNFNNTVTSPVASGMTFFSGFVSSTGADTIDVSVTNVYSAGTVTNQGGIRFVLI